jgi:hypothetical protein
MIIYTTSLPSKKSNDWRASASTIATTKRTSLTKSAR